jgi:DNA-directed RNA polymerase specialized sigma24 family protein
MKLPRAKVNKTTRREQVLTLYYLSGLCRARIARHVGCCPPTVDRIVAQYGPAFKKELEENSRIPKTIRGRRWD